MDADRPAVTCPRCATGRAGGRRCPACGLLAAPDDRGWQVAEPGRRLAGAALFLPALAVFAGTALVLFALIVTFAFGGSLRYTNAEGRALIALLLTPACAYAGWWLAVAPQGQTPVKLLLGLRVVRTDGSIAGLWTMLLRSAIGAGVLNFLIPGYWLLDACWLLWDKDRQCLHDKLAGTLVVHAEPVELTAGAEQRATVTASTRWCAACGSGMLPRARYCAICGTQAARAV